MCGALVLLALVALLPLVGAGGLVSRPAVPSSVVECLGGGCAPVPEARGAHSSSRGVRRTVLLVLALARSIGLDRRASVGVRARHLRHSARTQAGPCRDCHAQRPPRTGLAGERARLRAAGRPRRAPRGCTSRRRCWRARSARPPAQVGASRTPAPTYAERPQSTAPRILGGGSFAVAAQHSQCVSLARPFHGLGGARDCLTCGASSVAAVQWAVVCLPVLQPMCPGSPLRVCHADHNCRVFGHHDVAADNAWS